MGVTCPCVPREAAEGPFIQPQQLGLTGIHWFTAHRVTPCLRGPGGTWILPAGAGSRIQDGTKSPKRSRCLPSGCCGDAAFRELNSESFLELFPRRPEAAAPRRGAGAAGRPRSQPPNLALPFPAESVPPGISEFSARAARQTAARGRTDGCRQPRSCACRSPAPNASCCQGHGVVKPRAWWLRGQDGCLDGDLVASSQQRALQLLPGTAAPCRSSLRKHPARIPPRLILVLPRDHQQLIRAPAPAAAPGKTHAVKHVHASLLPISPLVTSKHLMSSN